MANDKPHPGEPVEPGKPEHPETPEPKGPPVSNESGGNGDPPGPK